MLSIRTHVYTSAYIYARPIFHPISVQDSDVVDGGKKGGRNTTDQKGSWKADRIRRYCSFESGIPWRFVLIPLSLPLSLSLSPPFSPSLFPSSYSFRSLSENERNTFFSFFLSFPRTLPERTPSVNLDANASLSGLQIESGLATCLS